MDRTSYVAVIVACLISVFAWSVVGAGGPPGAPGMAPGAGMVPPPGPGAGAPAGEGAAPAFGADFSGGAGRGAINGGFAGSPELTVRKSGFAYNLRAGWCLQSIGVPINVYGDFYRAQFSGSATAATNATVVTTAGRAFAVLPGDNLSVEQDVNLYAVTGDINLMAASGLTKAMTGGLRLQWANFQQTGTNHNETRFWASEMRDNFSMFGIGAFLVIDPGNFLGSSLTGVYGSISPALKLGVAFGKGSNSRYVEAEAVLDVLQVSGGKTSAWSTSLSPSLKAQLGYVYWRFDETRNVFQDPSALVLFGLNTGTANTSYDLGFWLARAAVDF